MKITAKNYSNLYTNNLKLKARIKDLEKINSHLEKDCAFFRSEKSKYKYGFELFCQKLEKITEEQKIRDIEQGQLKWISVKDELPKPGFTFLAVMNHGAIYTMRLPVLLSKNKLTETNNFTKEHVTHWMTLPKKP